MSRRALAFFAVPTLIDLWCFKQCAVTHEVVASRCVMHRLKLVVYLITVSSVNVSSVVSLCCVTCLLHLPALSLHSILHIIGDLFGISLLWRRCPFRAHCVSRKMSRYRCDKFFRVQNVCSWSHLRNRKKLDQQYCGILGFRFEDKEKKWR